MEGPSLKVIPTMPENLQVSMRPTGPTEPNCIAQLAQIHPLHQSELKYNKNKSNISMHMLRNREGLHAPLKISMELHAASKVGRLPFLPSSNIQRDVLLGRDEIIEFSDFLGTEDTCEVIRQPHAVVEKTLGLL